MGELPLDADPWLNTVFFFGNETKTTTSSVAYLLTVIGQVLQYFALVSGALFLPYEALQRCKQSAATSGAGATYNYLIQAAPTPAAVTTTAIHQEIQVGGTPAEAAPAEPHQGGCNKFRIFRRGRSQKKDNQEAYISGGGSKRSPPG